jgi:biopolymer transport protein ExbD
MAGVSGGSSKDGLSLNLMPMLDIFSILITFLLMSYSTDPVSYDVNAGLELPESVTLTALDEIPAIVVSKTEILVNGKKVTTIEAGDVPAADQKQGASYSVFKELEALAEANKRIIGKARDNDPEAIGKTGTLTLEMDQLHRFKLMKRIMLAAQQSEFVTMKLMVAKND